ncbi:MAG TPA: DUF3106 domain-containing protein [Methylomirabilota bacterium]|nr:DUF3106 domain-containing protein [Methylomirabilota bacterium]
MSYRPKFGKCLAALAIFTALAMPCAAQKPHANPAPQNRTANRPANPPKVPKQADRPPRNAGGQNANAKPSGNVNPNVNRPPNAGGQPGTQPNFSPNRPPNAYTPPRREFNKLNPQEQKRTLNNYRDYEKRTPAERQQIQESKRNWDRLTEDQKRHIKNEIMPKWQQLPPDRQRAIRSRLNVLKNMPESARNQHLNDPNFTRGLREEDKAMLRDLSHMHVGGAPEPPGE